MDADIGTCNQSTGLNSWSSVKEREEKSCEQGVSKSIMGKTTDS